MRLRESELSGPVSEWLRSRGLEVYAEVPYYYRNIDLVGAVFEPKPVIISVELKTSFNKKVIHQACIAQTISHMVYACAFSDPSDDTLTIASKYGVGLLRVVNGKVTVLMDPQPDEPHASHVRRLQDTLSRMPKGGVGGKPCLKGVGPAQTVYAAIKAARELNPKITWKELFATIPNHYVSYRSMQNAMHMVDERRAWQKRHEAAKQEEEQLKKNLLWLLEHGEGETDGSNRNEGTQGNADTRPANPEVGEGTG